jgi:hypothetical protein
MGIVRFAVGVSGVPYERATHFTSLTILVFFLAVVYGQRAAAKRFGAFWHLAPLAVLLAVTMYGIIIVAIAIEGLAGLHGFFHSPGSGFAPREFGITDHILGQLSVMWIVTAAIFGTMLIGYSMSRHLGHLRYGFLLLGGLGLLRFFLEPMGVPYAVGGWITNLTLSSTLLAAYFCYRSPRELDRCGHALLLAFAIAFFAFHVEVYGFVISDALRVETFYTTARPAESIAEHIRASLYGAPPLIGSVALGALVGTVVRRRALPPRDRSISSPAAS